MRLGKNAAVSLNYRNKLNLEVLKNKMKSQQHEQSIQNMLSLFSLFQIYLEPNIFQGFSVHNQSKNHYSKIHVKNMKFILNGFF